MNQQDQQQLHEEVVTDSSHETSSVLADILHSTGILQDEAATAEGQQQQDPQQQKTGNDIDAQQNDQDTSKGNSFFHTVLFL